MALHTRGVGPRPAPRAPARLAGGRLTGRRPRALLLCLALATVAVACADDGRALREPRPDQTTTTRAPTTEPEATALGAAGVPAGSGAAMRLSSATMTEGEAIPDAHTCRGADKSPSLAWANVPAETAELAVVVRDLDAGGFIHWVVAGIPPNVGGISEDGVPAGAVEARNDFGREGWSGPCPPQGTHHYEFRVYTLAQPSGVVAGQPGAEAAATIEGGAHLGSAALSATAAA